MKWELEIDISTPISSFSALLSIITGGIMQDGCRKQMSVSILYNEKQEVHTFFFKLRTYYVSVGRRSVSVGPVTTFLSYQFGSVIPTSKKANSLCSI